MLSKNVIEGYYRYGNIFNFYFSLQSDRFGSIIYNVINIKVMIAFGFCFCKKYFFWSNQDLVLIFAFVKTIEFVNQDF